MAHLNSKQKRAARVRRQLRKVANGRPRLSVHRSNMHIYAQIIDDEAGRTLAAASTMENGVVDEGKGGNVDAASKVGRLIAERASAAGIDKVIFDRGGFIYHGRVKALAEAAREGGLSF